MAQTMTASQKPMTSGQVENLVSKFRAALTKHRTELTSQAVQQVLGLENLGMELYGVIRTHAQRITNLLTRTVHVDRTLTPRQALDATGRRLYVNDDVVATMPRGTRDKVTLYFFKPEPEEYTQPGWMSDDDLEKAFARRDLVLADPYALAKDNQDDPAFADTHPNGTHWKDANGKWCFATFSWWDGVRGVGVDRSSGGWSDGWWFAGVRK